MSGISCRGIALLLWRYGLTEPPVTTAPQSADTEAGFGVFAVDPLGRVVFEGRGYLGSVSNNVAEFTAFACCMPMGGGVEPPVSHDSG